MPKNSQYKFVFLSVQIKGLSRVMFDGHFIHFYANYSQRNHFGVFLVMQFDRDYNPVQAHRWIDLQWVANVLLIKTTGVSKKKPQDEKLWAVSWIKTISPLVLRHTFNKWNGHVLTVFLCVWRKIRIGSHKKTRDCTRGMDHTAIFNARCGAMRNDRVYV